MAKNTVSKKLFAGILALSGAFVLAACDTVNALPKNYEDPIVESKESLTDNQMGKIWEAIVSGKAEYIHDEIIVQIAENQFGTYFTDGEVKGIADITADEDIKAFIAAHESVFIREGDDKLAGTGDIYETVRKPRFLAFKADIEQRLAEKLYEEISGGNYVDREGRFCELKMAAAHWYSGYDIVGFEEGVPEQDDTWNRVYVNASIVKDDLTTIDGPVIHVARFKDYIQRKLIREIYKEKLIEEYVFENKYSTLGRAYGRDVNYVKLSYTDDNKVFAQKILRAYADEYIYEFAAPNMELVANTWRGVSNITYDVNGQVESIVAGDNINALVATSFTATTISAKLADEFTPAEIALLNAGAEEQLFLDYSYYPESKAGNILERYFKACRAVIDGASHVAATKDQSELDSFTGTNAHSRVKGLKEEFSKLVLEDYTVDEWGLKNGGFSELPSAVRERLFNINVANAVDNFTGTEGSKYVESSADASTVGKYATSGLYSYVRDLKNETSGNDYYYLNKADALRYEDDKYSFIFDEDSSYTIVNVKEAASSTKLNINAEKGYFKTKTDDPLFTENAAREIAKLLGTKESYKTDAYQHYLEKFNLNFSDQELYDYFVSAYPDLYGEDD